MRGFSRVTIFPLRQKRTGSLKPRAFQPKSGLEVFFTQNQVKSNKTKDLHVRRP